MPEIVELKIFSQSISDRFLNKEVVYSACVSGFDIAAVATGKKLTRVCANGKEMFFFFDDKPAFKAHLMLNGGFAVLNRNTRPAAADVIAELQFGDEFLMLFDPDGYAKLQPFTELPQVPEVTEITEQRFFDILERKGRAAIKNVLLDQNLIRGIGNAYADEILYAAKVHPNSKCGKIPHEVRGVLYKALSAVINSAIQQYSVMYKGVTCGEMRDLIQVHTRARYTRDGEIIKVINSGGRKTYFASSQVLYN